MTPAKIYPFSIPAGGSFPLTVLGDYCKILTSSGALSLTGDTFGTLGPILAGQGIENTPFNRLMLTDSTEAVNNGTILIADNKFIDDRITGEVSVIDGGKNRTYANQAFCGAVSAGPVAAQYACGQIWNPPGSGKNVIVSGFQASSTTAQSIYSGFYNTALAGSSVGLSKLATGTAGVATRRTANTATNVLAGVALTAGFVLVSQNSVISFKEPVVVTPGTGFTVLATTVNTDLNVTFEYFEESIL